MNKMHGKGILYYANNKKAYEGEWNNDKFNKFGHYYNEKPTILNNSFDYKNFENVKNYWEKYEGDFTNDQKNGHGIWYLSNGEKYAGSFQNDHVHGYGTFYMNNGDIING